VFWSPLMMSRPTRTTLASLIETTLVGERHQWCECQEKGQVTNTDYVPEAKSFYIWYIPAGCSRATRTAVIAFDFEAGFRTQLKSKHRPVPVLVRTNISLDSHCNRLGFRVLIVGYKCMPNITYDRGNRGKLDGTEKHM
jgi:hypothetical protein